MENKFAGAMLGMAIGEAMEKHVAEGQTKIEKLCPSSGTDMALMVGESLIEGKGVEDDFLTAFTNRLRKWHAGVDPQNGVALQMQTCFAACWKMAEGVDPDEAGVPTAMDSGANIRAVPVGLCFSEPEKVVVTAISAARITHPHELCLCGSVAAAYITHLALTGVSPGVWANELVKVNYCTEFKDLVKLSAEKAGSEEATKAILDRKELGSGIYAHESVAFALLSCMRHPQYNLAVALAASTGATGAAAMTGAWLGATFGREGIPEEWIEKLEGKEALLDMADRLWRMRHHLPPLIKPPAEPAACPVQISGSADLQASQ